MSVFKKLAGLLFEEADAEVLAEDELEPIEIKEKPKKATASPVVEEEKTHVQMEAYFNPHAAAAKEPKKEEKKFVTIDLEEKPKEKEKEAIVLSEEPLRVKKPVKREEKKEFEFSPVISPIFGSSEEESKPKKKSAAPLPQRSKKKNPLGTIISPYYGVGELEEFEAKAQEKIEEKEKLKKEELPQQEVEKYDLEEEINSVPLEDMIEKTPGEDGDDLMQISLFGESTPISSVDDASDKE
ncbi:internalin [[Clostridium] innocuum]|uniref:internalin n=1 Tax=Clostridium innocuum TaxID=1522 RepID=UPI000D6ACD53|nr:internalin [[Clostridium] innocuum]PWJ18642.1 hypothetical protein ATF84_102262 [[Clostridium] innocuum]SSA39082.1 hypothetical protein SAMN04487929_102262 [[Clostridium] innocuum]